MYFVFVFRNVRKLSNNFNSLPLEMNNLSLENSDLLPAINLVNSERQKSGRRAQTYGNPINEENELLLRKTKVTIPASASLLETRSHHMNIPSKSNFLLAEIKKTDFERKSSIDTLLSDEMKKLTLEAFAGSDELSINTNVSLKKKIHKKNHRLKETNMHTLKGLLFQ